jgi:hypothetical protein
VTPGEAVPSPVAGTLESTSLALRPIPAILTSTVAPLPWWFWILWLIPPLATLGIWWRVRQLTLRHKFAAQYRRSEALKKASKRLGQIQKKAPEEGFHLIGDAIMNYMGDKLDQPVNLLNYADIEEALQEHSIQPETAALVMGSLKRSDQARFAPIEMIDARTLGDQVNKILTRVDMMWQ